MKKTIAFILLIIFGCSAVLAASSNLYFHSIIYDEEVEEGTDNEFYITTEWKWEDKDDAVDDQGAIIDENDVEPDYYNQKELYDMKAVIFIPELGVVAYSLPYNQEQNDPVSNRIFVDLDDAPPGEYVARITVSNDYEKRIKQRYFVIE